MDHFYFTLPLPPSHDYSDICNFACEMTITYFQLQRLYLPDCYSMSFTNLWNYCLIGWWCEISFCLLDGLILVFCYSNFDMGNRWTQTRIDYILVLYAVCMYYKWFTWIIRCNFWDNSKTPLLHLQTWSSNTSLKKEFFWSCSVTWRATGHYFQAPFVFHNHVH